MTERARRAAEHRDAMRVLVPEDAKLPKLTQHDRPYEVWMLPKVKGPTRRMRWLWNEPWRVARCARLSDALKSKDAHERGYWGRYYTVEIRDRGGRVLYSTAKTPSEDQCEVDQRTERDQ